MHACLRTGGTMSRHSALARFAVADEWLPPKTQTYYSANGRWRLTVVPRSIESPLKYFSDKVNGRSNPGAPPRNAERSAHGFMEHLSGRTWELVWNAPLVNDNNPVSALMSNQGAAVTFDNWGSMGFGDDVVVIYGAHGRKIRNLALSDFLPKEYIHALPRSVSSIWWSGEHRLSADGKQLTLRVVIPPNPGVALNSEARDYINIGVDMATAQVTPPRGSDWDRALARAIRVDERMHAQEQAEIAFHNSPLGAPDTDSPVPWYRYLVEAFFRMDSGRNDGYPETKVLPRQGDADYARLLGYVKDSLTHPIDDTGAIMFASPDQANLVRVIDEITTKSPTNTLPHARIYVTVTPALQAIAAKAVARTGAAFVPLDVTKTIPVRPSPINAQRRQNH